MQQMLILELGRHNARCVRNLDCETGLPMGDLCAGQTLKCRAIIETHFNSVAIVRRFGYIDLATACDFFVFLLGPCRFRRVFVKGPETFATLEVIIDCNEPVSVFYVL